MLNVTRFVRRAASLNIFRADSWLSYCDGIAGPDRADRIDGAVDAKTPLRSHGHRFGDAAIDLESGLRAARDDATNRRHDHIENGFAEFELRPGPLRLRQAFLWIIQRK